VEEDEKLDKKRAAEQRELKKKAKEDEKDF
jgi:hypothetical protein